MSQLEGLEGEERMAKMQDLNRTHYAAGMKDVEGMLKPEQSKRFKQIVFQPRGAREPDRPRDAPRPSRSPSEQTDKVKNLMDAQRAEMREAQQSAGGDRQAVMEKGRPSARRPTPRPWP